MYLDLGKKEFVRFIEVCSQVAQVNTLVIADEYLKHNNATIVDQEHVQLRSDILNACILAAER
jgi:hypothetical protein